MQMYRDLAPDWWDGIDGMTVYDFTEYLRCVFLESDVDVAVLTSNPGVDRAADAVQRRARRDPRARSIGSPAPGGSSTTPSSTRTSARPTRWRLGATASTRSGGRCTRSASSSTATGCPRGDSTTTTDTASSTKRAPRRAARVRTQRHRVTRRRRSPEDVGPAARAHPNVNFVIYHSGYELPDKDGEVEGPVHRRDRGHRREPADLHAARARPRPGRQRLRRARHHLVLSRAPARRRRARARQAARCAGRRQRHLGHRLDLVRAEPTGRRRVPRVPDPRAHARRVRLPRAHAEVKEKILGLNACRLYDIDAAAARGRAAATTSDGSARPARSSSAPACPSQPDARLTS